MRLRSVLPDDKFTTLSGFIFTLVLAGNTVSDAFLCVW